MAKLKPTEDRLVVRALEGDEKSMGGIFLPDTAKEKPTKGQVVAVGPGKIGKNGERIALAVKAGDKILFSQYSGNDVKVDGVEFKIISETEVLAVLE